MRRSVCWGLIAASLFTACKKEQPAAPPPAPVAVSAPAPEVVQPGMEKENPAEKEGAP